MGRGHHGGLGRIRYGRRASRRERPSRHAEDRRGDRVRAAPGRTGAITQSVPDGFTQAIPDSVAQAIPDAVTNAIAHAIADAMPYAITNAIAQPIPNAVT